MMCRYCVYWLEAKSCGFQEQSEEADAEFVEKQIRRKMARSRKCIKANKEVLSRDISCQDFVLYRNFWCDRLSQINAVVACIAQQIKQHKNCQKCRQGRLFWRYIEATQLEEKEIA